jgi:hypothetical protein
MARPKKITVETPEARKARLNANWRRYYANHKDDERERDVAKRKAHPEQSQRRTAKWRSENPEKNRQQQRAQWLWWKYKITVEEYDRLVATQGNRCGICTTDTVGGAHNKYWVVDHCHKTDVVRGLLCDACNRGGGCFKDNPVLLLKASEWFSRS